MRAYTISQDKQSGLWYAHMVGYAYIPVFGSFSEKKTEAEKWAAASMGLTMKDYREWKRKGGLKNG